MEKLICIVCPIGCSLEVIENSDSKNILSVTGNRCQRGAAYAQEEILSPKRVVTATCLITYPLEAALPSGVMSVRRVSVKTVSPCPRDKIPALLEDIYKTKITLPIKAGDIVIGDWNNEGVDVVATRTIPYNNF